MELNVLSPRKFTICTEENPQVNEVEFILKYLGAPCKVSSLTSSFTDKKWNGTFIAEVNNPSIYVSIMLVKGSGSFVDYVVYDHLDPNEESSTPVLLMESTKTTDSESRNTAINQRFTKFAVAKQRFPNTPLVLYYNTKQATTTSTSMFGRRLLATYGVKIYDLTYKDMLADAPPFTSVQDIIKAKNSFKEKKGNVSVKINETGPHTYTISAKLSKAANTTICHDPNKGLITGIASSIFSLDKEAKFIITNHCVTTDKISGATDKFWYANRQYDLKLEGCTLTSKGSVCPTKYWKVDKNSEKAATINYQNYMEKQGWNTVYHNHSSSARSYFADEQGVEHQVRKDVTIPDVVMVNKQQKLIQICEGKIMKDCLLGVKQLENLAKFMEYTQNHYKGYEIERGLCLYVNQLSDIETLKNKLSYKIFFALDSTGAIYT